LIAYIGAKHDMLDFYYGQEAADDPSAYLGGLTMREMIELKKLDVIPIERSNYCPNCDCYLSFMKDVSLKG